MTEKIWGIFTRDEALRIARQTDHDLVLLAEQGGEGFPVAKIMDFGKALYARALVRLPREFFSGGYRRAHPSAVGRHRHGIRHW